MAKNEKTHKNIASLAAKVLRGYKPTLPEAKRLAGTALTQIRDKK